MTNMTPDFPVDAPETPRANVPVRPMLWSIRRELWENRSVLLAPAAVAVALQFGFLISTIGMPHRRRAVLLLDPAAQRSAIGQPYDVAAMVLIFTAFLIGIFYCLDALHGERRDRSILFFKSLPVSDRTTVLSKASIPLVVLPAITFATVVITQFTMLLLTSAVLLRSGLAGTTWTRFNLPFQALVLLYGLVALAVWHAPIYGWLLLVSAWSKRAPFLWAVLPPLAVAALEKIAFDSTYFARMLGHRLFGFGSGAFDYRGQKLPVVDSLSQLTPGRYLLMPGVWFGLAFAALFVVAAIRLRRDRAPI